MGITNFTRLMLAAVLLNIGAALSTFAAGDTMPGSEAEIRTAVELGRKIREKKSLVPGALIGYGIQISVGSEPCGYALVKIEDAKGADGAVYKMTTVLKAASANDSQSQTADNSATLFLAADLGLLTGTLNQTTSSKEPLIDEENQQSVKSAFKVVGDVLEISSETTLKRKGSDETKSTDTKKIPLYGGRAIPQSAVLALVALAREQSPDLKNFAPICVLAVETTADMDNPEAVPTWISFLAPYGDSPKGTDVVVKVRSLMGDLNEGHLQVGLPDPQNWATAEVWPLDKDGRPLAAPNVPQPGVNAKIVSIESVEKAPAFDLKKIAQAMKTSIQAR